MYFYRVDKHEQLKWSDWLESFKFVWVNVQHFSNYLHVVKSLSTFWKKLIVKL